MNVLGITNAMAALAALTSSSGSKPAPTAQPASFSQALSREVAQRQPAPQPAKPQAGARPQAPVPQHAPRPQEAAKPQAAARPQQAAKEKSADAAPADDAAAPADAQATAAAAGTSATPQPTEAKSEEHAAADGSPASLADIPGAPQAALMMQLMNATPAAAPVADPAAAAATTAAATDAAAIASGKPVGKELPGQAAPDLRAAAGKNDAAATAQAASQETAMLPDAAAAFGKIMNDAAGQQAAKTPGMMDAEAPAAPVALAALQAAGQTVHAPGGHVDKLTPPVGTPAWDQALGQKIVWMSQGGEQTATLNMNPPDLGPMQVVLSVTNNQATVDFTAAQPEVRAALESALPRLREMMSESGVQLGQANVGAGSQQQSAGFGAQNRGGSGSRGDGLGVDDAAPQVRQGVVRMARNGAVDTFA